MTNEPLVSVLMTAYNREKYIAQAIESVLASTYSNFELIIVDDCSADNTLKIAETFQRQDARIKLFKNDMNLGDYPNRNKAASYAVGKYLKYLDSDDLIYPHGLEIFVSAMEKYPEAALGVGSNTLQKADPFPFQIPSAEVLRNHFFETGILNTGPTGVIIRREAFQKIGGFTGKRMVGDTELWFNLACHYDIVITQPSLVYWRQHDGQEFFDGVRSGLYTEMTLDLISELLKRDECTLTKDERIKVKAYYKKITSRYLLKSILKKGEVARAIDLNKRFELKISDYWSGIWTIRKGIMHN
jgi:glycosyltransferase involved in cell wall biosynthesis